MLFEKYKQTLWRLGLVAMISFLLSVMLFSPAQAAEYNCGTYGAGAYNEGQVCAAATDDDDGGLVNTGERALAFILPALAILAGTVMLYRLSRKRKQTGLKP